MKSKVETLPAPVGGWNARDAISQQPKEDAYQMINAFPNPTDVQLRLGSADHVTGITGKTVETLAAYNSATANELYAFVDNNIYDVSNAGAVGAAETGTTVTNARWQYINFRVPNGAHWLLCVNGVDKPMWYDGTTWTSVTHLTSPAITGYTSNALENFIHINEFKHRVWLIEKDSSSAWYLPTDSIGGAATEFDVGNVFSNGGYLMAMGTWTLDAGSGLDDHAVFISSRGQVAVYGGTDPASATTFSLIGVFNVGSPIGRRCLIKLGGDLAVITRDGVMPLSEAMLNSRVRKNVAISDKIRTAMTTAVQDYGGNFGWQLLQYPNANMLLLNVPISSTVFYQYVMNTITGAWCEFRGWDASCWEIFNDEIYFGGVTEVRKGWSGNDDDGSSITADIIPSFNYFGSKRQKRWTMVRPIFSATGTPSLLMGMNVDYDTAAPTGVPTVEAYDSSIWDTDLWDTATWGGDFQIRKNWQTVSGVGFAGSLHIKITGASSTVKWLATDYVYEDGAVI